MKFYGSGGNISKEELEMEKLMKKIKQPGGLIQEEEEINEQITKKQEQMKAEEDKAKAEAEKAEQDKLNPPAKPEDASGTPDASGAEGDTGTVGETPDEPPQQEGGDSGEETVESSSDSEGEPASQDSPPDKPDPKKTSEEKPKEEKEEPKPHEKAGTPESPDLTEEGGPVKPPKGAKQAKPKEEKKEEPKEEDDEPKPKKESTKVSTEHFRLYHSLEMFYPALEKGEDEPKSFNEMTSDDFKNWGRTKANDTAEKTKEAAKKVAGKALDAGKYAGGKLIDGASAVAGKGAELAKDAAGGVANAVSLAASIAKDKTQFGFTWLKELGIPLAAVGAAVGAKYLLKGFNQLGKGFVSTISVLQKHIRSRKESFNTIKKELEELKVSLDKGNFKTLDNPEEVKYTGSDIPQLLIGKEEDIIKNLETLKDFIDDSIKNLGLSVKDDINKIQKIINLSNSNSIPGISKLLEIKVEFKSLKQGTIEGYEPNIKEGQEDREQFVESHYSEQRLPGAIVLILYLPKANLKERKEWAYAYQHSQIFLGMDKEYLNSRSALEYLTIEQLKELTDGLVNLCDSCLTHQSFYESMEKQKIQLKQKFKIMFDNLAKREENREALVDAVTLKNNFIDKVYLPAAMDLHDYCARILHVYIRFIKSNINVLKIKET